MTATTAIAMTLGTTTLIAPTAAAIGWRYSRNSQYKYHCRNHHYHYYFEPLRHPTTATATVAAEDVQINNAAAGAKAIAAAAFATLTNRQY